MNLKIDNTKTYNLVCNDAVVFEDGYWCKKSDWFYIQLHNNLILNIDENTRQITYCFAPSK